MLQPVTGHGMKDETCRQNGLGTCDVLRAGGSISVLTSTARQLPNEPVYVSTLVGRCIIQTSEVYASDGVRC